VSVVAVDISKEALAHARRGVYRPEQLTRVPQSDRKRWFCDTPAGPRVSDEIRAMVVFSELNLVEPAGHMGRFDLILCRNVIIYFSSTLRRQLLERFHAQLNPGGVLLLGTSEGLYSLCDRFTVAYCGSTMYYLKE
jgi:chemotaxis protein methyltransferase CheR